jgi:hypothetical protein
MSRANTVRRVLLLQLGGVVGVAADRLEVVAHEVLLALGQALKDRLLEKMLEHVEYMR